MELLARFELATSSLPTILSGFCLALLVVNYWIKPLCIKDFRDLPTAACCSLLWVFCVGFSRPVSVLCRFLRVLNCVLEDLTCPLYALLISVSIHPQCDRFVRMTQLFRYTGNVRSVGDGDAGKAVPKLMGMQTLHTIFLCKVLQVTGRTVGMYRLGATSCVKTYWLMAFLLCSSRSSRSSAMICGSTSMVRFRPFLGVSR